MSVVTLYTLFLDDIRTVFIGRDKDEIFWGITLVCFIIFMVEIIVGATCRVDIFPNILLLAGSYLKPVHVARYRVVLGRSHRWRRQRLSGQCGLASEDLTRGACNSSYQSHSPNPPHPYRQTLQAGEARLEEGRGRWEEGEAWRCQEAISSIERKEEVY